jgi:hypothetical protein
MIIIGSIKGSNIIIARDEKRISKKRIEIFLENIINSSVI